jgi:hypothetical protein
VNFLTSNLYLKFAVEALLNAANPKGEPYFKTTHLHKMMFLLYKRLQRKNIDLKLPYSWYHFGPFMDAVEFERQVGISLSYYAPDGEATHAIGHVAYEGLPLRDAQLIEMESNKLVNEFKEGSRYKSDYLNLLLDSAYRYAPFEFQKAFNRGLVLAINQLKSHNVSNVEIELYLDHLVKIYPYSEMHELYDAFLEWDDTIRLALVYNKPIYVANLAMDYWYIYSELLRIKENENLSEDIINRWSLEFPDKYDRYVAKIERERAKLLREYRTEQLSSIESQGVVDKMNDLAYQLAAKR